MTATQTNRQVDMAEMKLTLEGAKLINADFSEWNEGAPSPVGWSVGGSSGCQVIKSKGGPAGGFPFITLAFPSHSAIFYQDIPDPWDFAGKSFRFSCRVRADEKVNCYLAVWDGLNWVNSPKHSNSGQWEFLLAMGGISEAPTALRLHMVMERTAVDPDPLSKQMKTRNKVAAKYIRGEGIEIGACHVPVKTAKGVHVRYVDMMTAAEMREKFKYLPEGSFVREVDIIDDGEKLDSIEPESVDFIIANHFFEHCANPIGTLKTHLSKLRPGGTLFYAIPDKRHTFDSERPETPFEHTLADYVEGPQKSAGAHYLEWVKYIEKIEDHKEAVEKADSILKSDARIHFHVWTSESFSGFLAGAVKTLENAFRIETLIPGNGNEFIVVLRKAGDKRRPSL